MQLKIYILIFSCIFLIYSNAQNNDTLKIVEVHSKKDSILKLTVINSNVPHYVLDKNKLNEISADNIGDAIKFIPGTYIKDYGGIGGLKTVSYRSLGASHTSIEIDGVILPNTQTGTVNLSNFDVFAIESVEMTSGQVQNHFSTANSYIKSNILSINSSLFNIPKQKINVKVLGLATSIHAYQGGLLYQQKLGNYFSIGLQSLYTLGSGQYPFSIRNVDSTYSAIRQNAELQNIKLKNAITYKKNNLKIYINSQYIDNQQQLPGAVVLYNPYNDQSLKTYTLNSSFNLQYKTHQFALGLNTFYQKNRTLYRDNQYLNQQGYLENAYDNQTTGGGLILNRFLKTETQKIFIGVDFIHSRLKGDQFPSTPFRNNLNSVLGFSKWINRFKFQGNLSHQFINDNTPNNALNISHFSPFISLAYLPFKKYRLRLRSHFKNTYRLPTFNELYYNLIGNSNLKAENAQSFNLGVTFSQSIQLIQIETTIDVYQNQVKDKIVAIPTKNLFNWSMQNIGDVLSRGIDGNFLVTYKKDHLNLTISSGQSFNTSIDVTDKNAITYGHQIPYTPKYTASYSSSVIYKKTQFTLTLLHTGTRYVLNENIPSNLLNGFIDFGIGLSRTFKMKNQNIYANLQAANLLNKNYEVIKSFPMPGRHVRFKVVYSFNSKK